MKHIPTETDLNRKIKLVEITVTGDYIARIDDKRTTSKPYSVKVLVPENFTPSDVKRQTPKALKDNVKEYGDFVYMRTHEWNGNKPVKTEKSSTRKALMSAREIVRIETLRREALAEAAKGKSERLQSVGGGLVETQEDETELDERGLPPMAEPQYAE